MSYGDLQILYDNHGWADRLAECEAAGRIYVESQPGRGACLQTTLKKYRDEDGNPIAFIIVYKLLDGPKTVIRMLREGDTVYYGPLPIQPPKTL